MKDFVKNEEVDGICFKVTKPPGAGLWFIVNAFIRICLF